MKEGSGFTEENLSLEELAEKKITEFLEKYGTKFKSLRMPKSLSMYSFKDHPEIRIDLKNWLGSKLDSLATRRRTGENYIIEFKGKTKDRDKTIVDKNPYDFYYEMKEFGIPFLYFIYVKETDTIYRHEITNPSKFEVDCINGTEIYRIPEELIHIAKPEENKRLDTCMRIPQLTKFLSKRLV